MRKTFTILGAALAVALSAPALADASRLGKDLTPMGAERAGNAAGTIPAGDGGLASAPAGHQAGGHYADPFAADKPLFTIDAANVDQHADKLTPGQVAMLKTYSTWKMNVYPTRRSAAFPQGHYDQTIANASRAKLVDGGRTIEGTTGGIPFPIPQDGAEAIWNHLARYRGESYAMNWSQAAVTRQGTSTPLTPSMP
mgnify:CR=1 FL=1